MKWFARTMAALLLLPQAAIAQSQAQPAARGRIEGIVLQAGGASPQPVAGARVGVVKVSGATGANLFIPGRATGTSLTDGGTTPFPGMPPAGQRGAPPPPQPPPQPSALPIPIVTTERDGRFVVPNLEEGSYRIAVANNGYVRQEYGQRVFPGQGTLINLAAGEVLRDITIHLTATGNLGGRIVDGDGLPAVAVALQLLKAIYNQNGQRVFQNAGNARTNDRGEYRFYWVTPGRYYLVGGSSSASVSFGGGGNNSPNDPGDSYTFTYYPGVTEISRATPVEIRSGNELVLDFVIPKQQYYTVSGKVTTDPTAITAVTTAPGALPSVTISLAFQTLNGGNGVFTMGQAYDAASGAFTLRDVIPGSYVLQAAAPPSSARVPIEVQNSNIENLVLVVDSGVDINGRFIVEGGEMPAPNTMRVQMRLVTNGLQNFVGFAPSTQAGADGSFSLAGVLPGEYRVTAPPSQDFYVKELRYDRRDALNAPVEISRRNSESGTMEVVISRNVAQIGGAIVDDRMQPVPGVQAVLIPDARSRTDLYKTATTDQTGRFTMRGVPPGDYKLFAWEALENFGYFDPDVMRRSEALGKAVRVSESSRLSVETKIIPVGN